ncbi:MAG: hypothetical protein ACYTGP_02755 [Planctomycetota bacterium]|jgi:hypothetical protein
MIPRSHDPVRALRSLPMLDPEPAQIAAILERTAGFGRDTARPGPAPRRTLALFAAAAMLAVTSAGAWIATRPPAGTTLSERELAQLDADVERALVHLGRVLHRTERLTTIEVLGASDPDATNPSTEGATP